MANWNEEKENWNDAIDRIAEENPNCEISWGDEPRGNFMTETVRTYQGNYTVYIQEKCRYCGHAGTIPSADKSEGCCVAA